jgi:hypothetical protein
LKFIKFKLAERILYLYITQGIQFLIIIHLYSYWVRSATHDNKSSQINIVFLTDTTEGSFHNDDYIHSKTWCNTLVQTAFSTRNLVVGICRTSVLWSLLGTPQTNFHSMNNIWHYSSISTSFGPLSGEESSSIRLPQNKYVFIPIILKKKRKGIYHLILWVSVQSAVSHKIGNPRTAWCRTFSALKICQTSSTQNALWDDFTSIWNKT